MAATRSDERGPNPATRVSGLAAAAVARGDRGPTLRCASTVARTSASGVFASIDNLREIMDCCLDGRPLDGGLGNWLGEAIDGYLSRQFRTLDEGLGLVFPRGGVPWWREEAIRKRNAALRYLAETFLDELAFAARVQMIRTTARRYAASAWRFDQDSDEMPAHYAGTPKECLWRAFKSRAPMPIGERQLRNILGH